MSGRAVAAWAYTSTSTAHEVVAVRASVQRGEVITREDLVTVRVGVDPALKPIPAAQLDSIVGQRAALDLAAGGLVTADQVAPAVLPAAGHVGGRGGAAHRIAAGGAVAGGGPGAGGRHAG